MEIIVGIGIILAIIAFINYLGKDSSGGSTRSSHAPRSTPRVSTKRDPNLYRPSLQKQIRPPIKFQENYRNTGSLAELEIKDLVDALTGAPLQLSLGLYQCKRCKVFYQPHSVEVIRSENGGRCVACQQAEIVNVTGRSEQRGRNADVSVITLENYRQFEGHIITFEGLVQTVLISRRGIDYAVMFENRSWTRGFKMVFFRGDVEQFGGPKYLFNLIGHRVLVRGLLVCHEKYGYQIIVSDRAMILGVK
jgi:hypothetical protein